MDRAIELTEEKYKGIEIDVPAVELTDEMLQQEMDRFAQQFATWEPVKDGGIDWDDYVEGQIAVVGQDWDGAVAQYRAAAQYALDADKAEIERAIAYAEKQRKQDQILSDANVMRREDTVSSLKGALRLLDRIDDTGPLAHDETIAVLVKRTARSFRIVIAGGHRSCRAKAGERQRAHTGLGPSRQHDVGISSLQDAIGVADGVGPGRASNRRSG